MIAKFFRGEVDKYSWVDVGSSFLPSELIAAFLYSQLENADDITAARLAHHDAYRHRRQHDTGQPDPRAQLVGQVTHV